MSDVENERTKLTANFLNAIASGTVLASVVVPFIGVALGTIHMETNLLNALSLSLLGVVAAIVIHLVARRALSLMEE